MLDKLKSISSSLRPKKKAANQANYLVGLDIGTENVKALIGRVIGNDLEIVGVGRSHQDLSDMQAGAIADIGKVVAHCDDALRQAEELSGVSARAAVIGIAGELVKGMTISVRCSRSNPDKPLDDVETAKIIALVQNRAEAKAREQLNYELGGKNIDIRLVNSAHVRIEIDGYAVTNPIGFSGREVVVKLYTAFAPLVHIGALERTAQQLDLDLIAVAAEPFAVARSVIGDKSETQMSAILMDVGGGTTDIAVIDDGGVQGTRMFGIGGRAFTKSVERELSVDFNEAEELKLGLSSNRTPKDQIDQVEAALGKTLGVWVSGVELALDDFDNLDHLPNKLLLCGGGSSLDLLVRELETSNWYRELPFTKRPVIQHIQPEQVVGISDATGQVNDHTFITAMGLLRVGLDTIGSDSAVNHSLKAKLDRMLKV